MYHLPLVYSEPDILPRLFVWIPTFRWKTAHPLKRTKKNHLQKSFKFIPSKTHVSGQCFDISPWHNPQKKQLHSYHRSVALNFAPFSSNLFWISESHPSTRSYHFIKLMGMGIWYGFPILIHHLVGNIYLPLAPKKSKPIRIRQNLSHPFGTYIYI